MPVLLYIWKDAYPWDVRAEKVCSAFRDRGFRVVILARWKGEEAGREEVNGIQVIRTGYKKNSKLSVPLSINPVWKNCIKKAIEEFKPDIVMPRDILLASAAADQAWKKDIPVIMDMAENYPAAMKDWKKYNASFIRRFLVHNLELPSRVESKSVKKMDGIVTVCREQNERLNHIYAFPFEKMQVAHNTPVLSNFGGIDRPPSQPPIVFGHHGFMSAEKSLTNLVRGFLMAAEEMPDLELRLAGIGECYDDLKAIAESSPYGSRIKFTGKYNFRELPAFLESIDVGVIPYQHSDFNNYTIHNKLFDFFAAGRPVIVTDMIPTKRVVEETGTGLALDSDSPEVIAEALKNSRNMDIAGMSENAKKAAAEIYNWQHDSETLIDFVNKYI